MRPADGSRVWRKQQRAEEKGVPTGRRRSHKVETQNPMPGSTWSRRHRQALPMWTYLAPSDGA